MRKRIASASPFIKELSMNAAELVAGLGAKLGVSLKLGEAGTCRVHFDDDTVDFEQSGDSLYIMADMGSASGREEAYGRLLTANCLGAESGGACIGLDAAREIFTLHVILRGDIPYEFFEAELTRFLKALRYWKEWLALPAASASPAQEGDAVSSFAAGMIRV